MPLVSLPLLTTNPESSPPVVAPEDNTISGSFTVNVSELTVVDVPTYFHLL